MPETLPFQIAVKGSILAASNGENLNMTVYGSRDDDDDDLSNIWK